jgi:hypothetical protein
MNLSLIHSYSPYTRDLQPGLLVTLRGRERFQNCDILGRFVCLWGLDLKRFGTPALYNNITMNHWRANDQLLIFNLTQRLER